MSDNQPSYPDEENNILTDEELDEIAGGHGGHPSRGGGAQPASGDSEPKKTANR